MLTHEETMQLILQSQSGDMNAKSELLQNNLPLVKSLIKRYIGRHAEYDDLIQIGSVGLLKAVDNFSTAYNVRFSTYAVPLILGEVKRHLRDDGYIKVSRSIKTCATKINRYIDEMRSENSVEPTLEQIADQFEMSVADVVFTLDSSKMPISIYDKSDNQDGKAVSISDRLSDDEHVKLDSHIMVMDMLSKLDEREQQLVQYRYFQDMTQAEISKLMGISQVQVSRLEYKIIKKLRNEYVED